MPNQKHCSKTICLAEQGPIFLHMPMILQRSCHVHVSLQCDLYLGEKCLQSKQDGEPRNTEKQFGPESVPAAATCDQASPGRWTPCGTVKYRELSATLSRCFGILLGCCARQFRSTHSVTSHAFLSRFPWLKSLQLR